MQFTYIIISLLDVNSCKFLGVFSYIFQLLKLASVKHSELFCTILHVAIHFMT